ncbi:hypothetical protein M569_00294, partial [Genlisea aurea]
ANDFGFRTEELTVDERLGYPEAYAKICRARAIGPFRRGPPFTFVPYELPHQEDLRKKEMDDLFPIIDSDGGEKLTGNPKIFVNLLWKQLNHLGNAGFDPRIIRVDPYGNVLYFHADSASPLAWEIDYWFPWSRGGLTVPSNLRILQWQVCRRKNSNLEFMIPWWDFQIGVSVNQFLSIFASSNSDFRKRAFAWLFSEADSQELHASQTVDCHAFPQRFLEAGKKIGMAPAAIVVCRKEDADFIDDAPPRPRSATPILLAIKKRTKQPDKENEDPSRSSPLNPHQAIAMARDSLKHRDEEAKMRAEMRKLDREAQELQRRSEEEKVSIDELEAVLMKKKKRAEKCRLFAESQSSYRVMLEKMIRDATHQNVVYKEHMRLNQAAASALMARLEAQRALCDSAERQLIAKSKQRDELEKRIIGQQQQQQQPPTRKRSRFHGSSPIRTRSRATAVDEIVAKSTPHKELREFLEEEQQKAAGHSNDAKITVLDPSPNNNMSSREEEEE